MFIPLENAYETSKLDNGENGKPLSKLTFYAIYALDFGHRICDT